MTFSVNPLEFVWTTVTLGALLFTITSYFDARIDKAAVTKLNGKARELSASRVVTRQALLVLALLLLLAVALPGLFLADGVPRPSWLPALTIGGLTAVPITLLVLSLVDTRDRKRLIVLLAADALIVKTEALADLKEMLAANTAISQEASDHADAAYREANDVNAKIARQGAALVAQGIIQADDRDTASTEAAAMKVTVDDTHERVTRIDERTDGTK